MEEKKFSKYNLAMFKRVAQNANQAIQRKNKLAAKIAELQAEYDKEVRMIELMDAPVRELTGGYSVEQIVKKVVTPTDKVDKNGNIVNITTFEFIYPDTIIPTIATIKVPETPGTAGSDFGLDTANQTQISHPVLDVVENY